MAKFIMMQLLRAKQMASSCLACGVLSLSLSTTVTKSLMKAVASPLLNHCYLFGRVLQCNLYLVLEEDCS